MGVLVSVLIAAFRSEEFIARPVLSVLRQTYPHWEIVIASDDKADYAQILHDRGLRDSRIRFASTGRVGAGAAAARNAALREAKGDIMAVLDSDDAFEPAKLESLVPRVLAHGAATSDLRIVRNDTLEEFPSLVPAFPAGVLSAEDYMRANLHGFSILMWDRARSEGRWHEELAFGEDLIHGLCMYNALNGIYYEPLALHRYYRRARSVTSSMETEGAAALPKIIAMFEDYILRARQGRLPVENATARAALVRFYTRCIANEKLFFPETLKDPVMGFYNFFAKNRAAFFDW